VPVDHLELLRLMVDRERREGGGIDGAALLVEGSRLSKNDVDPWDAVARAVELLDGFGCLILRLGAGEAPREPDATITRESLQAIDEIRVSATGLAIGQQPIGIGGPTQITIIQNSHIGHLGMGDTTVGDVRVLINAAREQLEAMDAPEDVKAEARTILERLHGAAGSVATSATASLVSSALQSAIGLR
jgi:hypothetical protein